MSTTATAIHALAADTDTALAEADTLRARSIQTIRCGLDELHRAAGDTREGGRFGKGPWVRTDTDVAAAATGYYADQARERVAAARLDLDAASEVIIAGNKTWSDNGHWSRFFLVKNTNGHIHSSMACSTCFATTEFAWLPELSGLTESEAVAAYGEILCSVCFPSAPAAWCNGESNEVKAARAEREAAKAERAAKAAAKAITAADGSPLRVKDHGAIKTLAAAKSWLTDSFEWNASYPRTLPSGEVLVSHPSHTPADVAMVAAAVAAKTGEALEVVLAAAAKRAAKRS